MQALLAETHYHLGRVLCEGELDFDRAVSELEEAVRLDPENIRAHYHLGQAIRQQIERNKFKRAEEVLRIYLMKGAPSGARGRSPRVPRLPQAAGDHIPLRGEKQLKPILRDEIWS